LSRISASLIGILFLSLGTRAALATESEWMIVFPPAPHPESEWMLGADPVCNQWMIGATLENPRCIDGLRLWMDADDASTITIATGVSQWLDKSGAGNHVTQASTTLQPVVLAGALNGRSVLRFDGSNDTLTRANASLNDLGLGATDITVFTVALNDDNSGNTTEGIVAVYTVTDNQRGWGAMKASGNMAFVVSNDGALPGDRPQVAAGAANNYYMTYFNYSSPTGTVIHNGTTDTASETGTIFNTPSDLYVGSFGSEALPRWDGNIAEILVYNRTLSAGERTEVEAYLSTKWGL
jgi:hypothetical protein